MTGHAEIAPGVFRITPGRSNCYLLSGEDLTLIDTGMPGDGKAVIAAIEQCGRTVTDLRHILITHAHLDHIGSLALLKNASGAKVVANCKETDYIQGTKKTWTMGREGFGGKLFKTVLFFMETFVFKYEPTAVDIPCTGGKLLDCFGGIQVVATPGHSPGSVSFYLKEKGLLFVGDALNGTGGFALPMRFGCASYKEAVRSVEQLSRLDFDLCLLGHGEPVGNNASAQMRELVQKGC
ncbi:MAG: MBL fold metallo-hydrolase [Proteobacteria bacterium]|nr:MBL fold metallo-hydrolase [Pseudomonadota bacterium]